MKKAEVERGTHPGRILLVDDNEHGMVARRRALEDLGYQVQTARSGEEGHEHLLREPFDLIVTDFKMIGMDGIQLIERIRQAQAGVPVILLSGFVDVMGFTEATTGADSVIAKGPMELNHLLRTVKRLLTHKPLRKPAGMQRRSEFAAARTVS